MPPEANGPTETLSDAVMGQTLGVLRQTRQFGICWKTPVFTVAMKAPIPANEAARLDALRRYQILDTPPEPVYDDLTRLAARLCDAPIAVINLVDGDRLWVKSRDGRGLRDTHRDVSFCGHAILEAAPLLGVPDLTCDPRFRDNPMVVGPPHLRFYAGAVLRTPDGYAIGTLAIMDSQPRWLTPEQAAILPSLARLIMGQLELRLLAETKARKIALEESNSRLQALATTDGLTGLKNQRAFQDALREQFAQAKRSLLPFSLVFLDVDHFKEYNDTFGHPAGDDVLKQIAGLLARTVREGDMVARPGGEEFAVILPHTDAPSAVIMAERLRQTLHAANWPYRAITASYGISTFNSTMPSHEQMVSEADIAMYHSKENGRDQVSLYPVQPQLFRP
jgi:diguanylate cyclase (GGDEF)-like protein